MITLTKEQVLILHDRLIEVTGGSKGIRDDGILELAFGEITVQFFYNGLSGIKNKILQ